MRSNSNGAPAPNKRLVCRCNNLFGVGRIPGQESFLRENCQRVVFQSQTLFIGGCPRTGIQIANRLVVFFLCPETHLIL